MSLRLAFLCGAFLAASVVSTPAAHADDKSRLEAAAEVFERGTLAQQQGDNHRAALEFARADELVPDPIALESALRAAVAADEVVLGMTLVERARHRSPEGTLAAAVELARAKFAQRAGRVTIRCSTCSATLDEATVATDGPVWILPGDHAIVLEQGGRTERRSVHLEAGASIDVAPSAPQALAPTISHETPSKPPPSSGISPAWFWASLGVTAVAGGFTIASAAHTAHLHSELVEKRTKAAAEDGPASQNVTNALALTTGALVLTTAAIGFFAVRWGGSERKVARYGTF